MSMSGRLEELEARVAELLRDNERLAGDNRRLVADLMRKSADFSDADDIVRRWRTELEIAASKTGHNLCHMWIPLLLKRTLGHTGGFPDPENMTREEFEFGCREFQNDVFGPKKICFGPPADTSGVMFDKKAVFFDRDGTVIEAVIRPDLKEKEITAPFFLSELKFYDDVHEAFDMLRSAGFMIILITNQPDPRHGYMLEGEWHKIHNAVLAELKPDDFYMCRHTSHDGCPVKKPAGLMLQVAADKHGIDLRKSFMVGDTWKDMDAGRAAGCRRVIMLNRNYNVRDESDDVRANGLKEAAEFIIGDR